MKQNTNHSKKRQSLFDILKEGLLFILPLWATIAIFQWIWSLIFSFFPDFARFFPIAWQNFPYFSILVKITFLCTFLLFILICGFIASSFLGGLMISFFDLLMNTFPIIRPIYTTSKKISSMIFPDPSKENLENRLTEAVLVPYPTINDWSIAFVTGQDACHIFGAEKGLNYLTVYMPSSPIVSSGFYLIVKRSDIRPCKKDAGSSLSLLLSAGSLQGTITKPKTSLKKNSWIQKYFLSGLLATIPILSTVSLFIWISHKALTYIRTMRVLIPENLRLIIPEDYFGLIANSTIILILLILIYILGRIGESTVGKGLQKLISSISKGIPIFNTVYEASSTITDVFTKGSSDNDFFSKAVLVPFPNEKLFAVGFVTNKDASHLIEDGHDYIPIFVPTSPIPTTGWLLNVKKDNLITLDMPVEKAIGLVISVGVSAPETEE